MSSTIVERILNEFDARKATREAILSGRSHGGGAKASSAPAPTSSAGHSGPAAPSQQAPFQLLARFQDEVVPAIGRTISTEISAALAKVRTDLIGCLEREFSRGCGAEVAPVPTHDPGTVTAARSHPSQEALLAVPEEPPPDAKETDLDLPAEEVNRELDRVFAQMEAPSPIERHPVPERRRPPDERRRERPAALPLDLPSPIGARPAARPLDPTSNRRADRPAAPVPSLEESREVEEVAPRRSRGARDAHPAPVVRDDDTGGVEGPAAGDLSVISVQAGREEAPRAAIAGPHRDLRPALAEEIREALIPGIADGISKVLADVEKGQERIGRELDLLARRVAGLETGSIGTGAGIADSDTDEAPRQIADAVETTSGLEAPVAAGCPGPVNGLLPLAPADEVVPPPPADVGSGFALLIRLDEVERRLLERLDGLVAAIEGRRAPSQAVEPGSGPTPSPDHRKAGGRAAGKASRATIR